MEELQLEAILCYADPVLKRVFDWCIANEKTVILTSDMYLDKETVTCILSKCGYEKYEYLYLSSELMMKKQDGQLFHFIVQDLSIEPDMIVHIGDNRNSDYKQARKKGINSILIARDPYRTSFFRNDFPKSYVNESIMKLRAIMNGFVSEQWDLYYRYGFEVIGPLLFGFSKWIHESAKKNNINELFFLARDGKLLQKAYQVLYAGEKE